jgi:acyl carrier protein
VVELIAFIEATYSVEMTDDDLKVENFKDIEAIINLILIKNGS